MRNIIGIALVASAMLWACDSGNKGGNEGTAKGLSSDKDPVCKMTVKDNVEDTAVYHGKVYGFCNPGCKDEFKKDPEKYLK